MLNVIVIIWIIVLLMSSVGGGGQALRIGGLPGGRGDRRGGRQKIAWRKKQFKRAGHGMLMIAVRLQACL